MTTQIKPFKHCYSDKDHPYRYSVVDIPVSLALGSIRTPEFSSPQGWYWIMVQVERPLPTEKLKCMMGLTRNQFDSENCSSDDPVLRADWTVWENGKSVSIGSSTTRADDMYTNDNIFKFLGSFPVLLGHKYVLEVKFIKDGSPLNIANPHLIVTKIGNE
jgi:hypothetical protein